MADIRGFMKHGRKDFVKEKVDERVKHWREFMQVLPEPDLKLQGSRCMDCGVPFCHTGCPLGNLIPDWNQLVADGRWREALNQLHATNNFPDWTGRICPAPCENACVLGINEDPVAIEQIEMAIAERGWENDWIKPRPPKTRTGKKVAVIGSGPAGLAAAQQLNRAGHTVTVFERDDRPGGLMTYGIPDFKCEKEVVFRRTRQIEAEGVEIRLSCDVGVDISVDELKKDYDAILMACGARQARDVTIPGRELKGVHFAMEFLDQQNRRTQGDEIPADQELMATRKDVLVIGGGDTGSDCVGTSNRHGANSITQFQYHDAPPDLGMYPRANQRPEETPWPDWTHMMRTSSSHEEGVDRQYAILTKEFVGDENGHVTGLKTVRLEWDMVDGKRKYREIPDSEKIWPTQLVLIAIGFAGIEPNSLAQKFGVEVFEPRGNVKTNRNYHTNVEGIFAAGDQRRGQSLVVWAIHEGREAARCVDEFLMGHSDLPSADSADYQMTRTVDPVARI
jgi:glutamate synthase (NADPH/NADH) small chain